MLQVKSQIVFIREFLITYLMNKYDIRLLSCNNLYLLLIRRKLAFEYDQMRLYDQRKTEIPKLSELSGLLFISLLIFV